jgi:hypothetical protein
MYVVIHQVPDVGADASGLLNIASRPLIARQIDWMRALYADRILVEIDDSAEGRTVGAYIERAYGPRSDVETIETSERVGARELANRVGVHEAVPLLAVPADLLGDGDLRLVMRAANARGAIALFEPPRALSKLERGTVRVVRGSQGGKPSLGPTMVRGPGWAVRVQSAKDALAVTLAVISESLPTASSTHVFPIEPQPKARSGVYVKVGDRKHGTGG